MTPCRLVELGGIVFSYKNSGILSIVPTLVTTVSSGAKFRNMPIRLLYPPHCTTSNYAASQADGSFQFSKDAVDGSRPVKWCKSASSC